MVSRAAAVDVQTYLQKEASLRQEKTKEAEGLLALGNPALERGAPQQARRAFQAAYATAPFVRLTGGDLPTIKQVAFTNFCTRQFSVSATKISSRLLTAM